MIPFEDIAVSTAKLAIQHRWRVIFLCVVITLMVASGARFLKPASDYRVFFRADNSQLLAYEALRTHYTNSDNILLAITPADKNIFSKSYLDVIADITEKAWKLPYVVRVDSLTNYQYSHATDDTLIVEDLYIPEETSLKHISELRNIAMQQPALVNKLLTDKADISGINISILLPGKNPMVETPKIVNAVRSLAAQLEQEHPGLKTSLTGVIMLNNAFAEASLLDMSTLIPGVFLIVLVLVGYLLRSGAAVVATMIVIFFSILTAMGAAGWMHFPMTPPMAVAPIIIMTLAVAHCVHLLLPAMKFMREGTDKNSAILESMRLNVMPIMLTSVTTGMGFLALNSTEVLPFHHLGNSAALGVMVAFVLSVVLLPALIAVLPLKVKAPARPESNRMANFSKWVINNNKILLVIMLILGVSSTAMITKNVIDENLIEYFDTSIPFRTDSDYIAQHLTGAGFIDYSLVTQANGVQQPDFLKKVEAFSQWLKQQPEVLSVNTIADTMKRLNKNMHNDDPSAYHLPQQANLAAQYFLLYESSLPYGLDINNQVNIDKSATRVSAAVKNMSAKACIDLDRRAMHWMQSYTPELAVMGSSPTMMFAHISMNNASSMLISTSLALAGISLVLIFALRSFSVGLLSLVPNLLPIGAAFGLWGLFNGEVGLGLSLVAATTLGIIVDDTVHFLHKYQSAKQSGKTSEQAVHHAFTCVGPALLLTSSVLIAGFLVLSFSVFKLNSDMGVLTAVTLGLALVFDFLLLPALLLFRSHKPH